MTCSTAFLALDFGAGLTSLNWVAQAIQTQSKALLSADVGFEATAPERLHATFVFHGELLQALTKPQLAQLHQELSDIVKESDLEQCELPFKRFELFPPGKQNLIIARFEAPKLLVKLRRSLWRCCLKHNASLKIDDEWLPHVTLGKLQASKAQLGGVTVAALEEFAPKLPIMVQGLTLLGTRPKQLWLDWEEAFQFREPQQPQQPQQPAANSIETCAASSTAMTMAYTASDPDAMQVASSWPLWSHEHSVEMPVPPVSWGLDKPPIQMGYAGYALPRMESTFQC